VKIFLLSGMLYDYVYAKVFVFLLSISRQTNEINKFTLFVVQRQILRPIVHATVLRADIFWPRCIGLYLFTRRCTHSDNVM